MDRRGTGQGRLLKDLIDRLDPDPSEQFFSPYPTLFVTVEVERWVDYVMDEQIKSLKYGPT